MLTGAEFKAVRKLCGYSAREVADSLKGHGAPASTVRAIYRIEREEEVPWRYVEVLRTIVGAKLFERSLREVRRRNVPMPEERPHLRDGTASRKHEPDLRGRRRRGGDEEEEERFTEFLNSLPCTGNTVQWITTFREALAKLLGDVDRIVVNINIDCDLDSPQNYYTEQIVTEHIHAEGNAGNVAVSSHHHIAIPSERLLDDFRRQGYPLERYHPPHSFDYYYNGYAYLGTLFLWRELQQPPVSERTLKTMARLQPFLLFALSDLVARARQSRPLDRVFNDALDFMIQTAELSEQERKVVILQLFGHSYEEVGNRLCISLDAVRKHVKSIYRKTRTHSYIELFAKYFTPRLGF